MNLVNLLRSCRCAPSNSQGVKCHSLWMGRHRDVPNGDAKGWLVQAVTCRSSCSWLFISLPAIFKIDLLTKNMRVLFQMANTLCFLWPLHNESHLLFHQFLQLWCSRRRMDRKPMSLRIFFFFHRNTGLHAALFLLNALGEAMQFES